MPSLKKDLVRDVLQEVRIVYLNKEISRWWNNKRSDEDTPVFCGFFWIHGTQEGGPFRTRSAAIRDAHYQFIANRRLPKVWGEDIPRSVLHPKKTKAKSSSKRTMKRSQAEMRAAP